MAIRKTDLPKIHKQKNGAYYAQMYIGLDEKGKRKFKSFYGYDKTALMREMVEYKAERQEGRQHGHANMTVSEAIDAYISSKSAVLSPSSIRGYRIIQRNCLQSIMSVKLCDLTPDLVQRAVNADAVRLAPKTVRNAHGLLTATLDLYRHGFNPSTTLPQKRKAEIVVPSADEVAKILDATKGTEMYLAVLLGACCGLRRSEISALTWSCVDFATATITIKGAMVPDEKNKMTVKGTKTIAGTRTIHAVPIVMEVLGELFAEKQPSPTDAVSIRPDLISNRFARLLKTAGVRHMRFHDLRHFAVSVMLSLNVPKNYIADYVGHETENMIDTVYGHVMADKKRDVEERLQGYFFGAFGGEK